MNEHWEILDLFKALMSVAAGLILGLERELKDKAEGLKTITIITLGATLFAIISYKAGGADHGTNIAAYIVSGVGFLGAGVIFKDGLSVSGLTTAGIIWIAAAIGTSIGFGEFYMAAAFLTACLLVIWITPIINSFFHKKQIRQLEFIIDRNNAAHKQAILDTITAKGIVLEEKKIELKEGRIIIGTEVIVKPDHLQWLESYLLNNAYILSFSV